MSNQLQTVSFAGTDLFIVNQAGKPFVPMRPIVEAMGMAWQSQHEKLKTKFASTITEIVTVAQDGKQRELTCLPLAKIAGWLYSVSPNKVAPEIREKVIQYQNECDTALFDYWTKGGASKHANTFNSVHAVPGEEELQRTKVMLKNYMSSCRFSFSLNENGSINLQPIDRFAYNLPANRWGDVIRAPGEVATRDVISIMSACAETLSNRESSRALLR
jgi:hypothetical protein